MIFVAPVDKQKGKNVQLVPYRREHVPTYHGWMQDPWIRGTAALEPTVSAFSQPLCSCVDAMKKVRLVLEALFLYFAEHDR